MLRVSRNPGEVLAGGRRRLEIAVVEAEDQALPADVADLRIQVERAGASGRDHCRVGCHHTTLRELRPFLGGEDESPAGGRPAKDLSDPLANHGDLAQLERVDHKLREVGEQLRAGRRADERVPVLVTAITL